MISDALFVAIHDAERATQKAHDLAYKEGAPYWLRTRLGKAQAILMRYVARHAGLKRGTIR